MTFEDYRQSLAQDTPPSGLGAPVEALWWTAKGDWDRAHALVQDDSGAAAAWVHAHLHRIEGDLGNAAYWYRRAGHPAADGPFEAEGASIAAALLSGA